MFEEELSKHEARIISRSLSSEDNGKGARPLTEQKKDEDKANEALAAGVMGNLQNAVVFILEGDSESAITTDIRIEDAGQPGTNQIVDPDNEDANRITNPNEARPESQATITDETPKFAASMVNAEASITKQAANTEIASENNTNAAGEVMARTPDIRTQDRQENTENNSKSSGNGNLSPLENENDKAQVKGQKEKTYSETADAVRSAAEDTEPAVNTIPPPLSEGIRPEQFRAAQQMTEATLNAPVKTENLFEEMISRVEMMQNDTKSTMTIQLNPEFLGKVALEVAVDAAGLHVKINAEDSGVRSMINGQLTTLIESLENKGIEVVEVEVVYTGVNYGTFQDPREEGQQQSRQQYTAKREVSSTDGVTYYAALPDLLDYYLETGVSSVEYRA